MKDARILPIAKGLFLCDDVLPDLVTEKLSLLLIFNAVHLSRDMEFPYFLRKMCVYASLRGGRGTVPARIVIASAVDDRTVYESPGFSLEFPDPRSSIHMLFRVQGLEIPDFGTYIVRLFCYDTMVEDEVLQVEAIDLRETEQNRGW